jgi:hypothetical protein
MQPSSLALRQGAILLGGALVYVLLAEGPAGFGATPFVLTGVCTFLALAEGGRSPWWLAAAALAAWGVSALDVPGETGHYALGLGVLGALSVLRAVGRPRTGERPDL